MIEMKACNVYYRNIMLNRIRSVGLKERRAGVGHVRGSIFTNNGLFDGVREHFVVL